MKVLKDVLLSQHRTIYYTATVTPDPDILTSQHAPANLKWQCACTLTSSKSVMERVNTNSPQYYQITYLGEVGQEQGVRN